MKSWMMGAIALVSVSVTGAALACPVGGDVVRPKPVVQNVSLQASELLERAGRIEGIAASREQEARALEREADALSSRARILRNEAGFANVVDRGGILSVAEELSARATNDRVRAAESRAQASELRLEAQNLRQRASVLVRGGGGGGGWRRVPNPRATGAVDTLTL